MKGNNNNSERRTSNCLNLMAITIGYLLTMAVSSCTFFVPNVQAASMMNPSFSLEDNAIDPHELLQAQIPESPAEMRIPQLQSSSFHVIDECVKITMEDGAFHFKSRGGDQVCGLYLVAEPDKSIVVTVDYLDVQCMDKGLISVVDGWELNGEVFPSMEDHEKPPQERFHDLCIDSQRKHEMRRTFTSNQNAALIQYRIPSYGQGFSLKVHHVHNPRPCNILIQDIKGLYTLENHGQEKNCSLVTLFDAKIRVLYMKTGLQGSKVKYPSTPTRIHSTGIYHKCEKRGLQDYVQIGGSSGLDTSKMQLVEEFCGYQSHPTDKYTTIFCGITTMRLVSSGKYQNKIVVEVSKADFDDLDSANYICGI